MVTMYSRGISRAQDASAVSSFHVITATRFGPVAIVWERGWRHGLGCGGREGRGDPGGGLGHGGMGRGLRRGAWRNGHQRGRGCEPRSYSEKIIRVVLSRPGVPAERYLKMYFPDSKPGACEMVRDLARGIRAFIGGEEVRFSLDQILLDGCTRFQRSVLLAERRIPRGNVSTYGNIAAHLGLAGAARAVGSALATNPFPIIIPCHRAIRSDGSLGGFQGGLRMKRALLEQEGVRITQGGRVVMDNVYYRAG